MRKTGVAFGRFQILHLGHLEYLLEAKKRCEHLIIGITNPDPEITRFDETCPHRSEAQANPFTFYERLRMIEETMTEAGIFREEFTIVPMPINYPERIRYYIPDDATVLLTIYDEWGWERKKIIENLGYELEILWMRTDDTRITSGTEVREKIARKESWKDVVPEAVYRYIKEHNLEERLSGGPEMDEENKYGERR